MKIVLFYHSLLSDWNHGNAHFLRGVVSELMSRGHDVHVYEPLDAWSLQNLRADHGEAPIRRFFAAYPGLSTTQYDPLSLNLDEALDEPPGYRMKQPRKKRILEPFAPVIEQILQADRTVHRKQRHTAQRIFDRLRSEHGYPGGITIVRAAVRAWHARAAEVFVPLS